MNGLLITSFVVSCSLLMSAQEWHSVPSSFCSQIKARGAKVSRRPFSIFEAPSADSTCCEGLSLKTKGKTEDFGQFKVLGLSRGRYFLSFDLKTKQVNVPISVNRVIDQRYIAKGCEPDSRITIDKATNGVKWEEWVIVD